MSEQTLIRYYTRIHPLGVGDEIKTSLPELAEKLFTSVRHARTMLNQMHQLGWLSWQPKAGRGQRSGLVLNIELSELKQQLASQQILQGHYDKALALLDHDEALFGQLLQRTSGASMREGRLHIQLTYKRAFERLVPHQIQRSSERYLIRQLYSCLVGSNPSGELEPQLAHHWDFNDKHWRFYLRPGLSFHNGHPINADIIVELFEKLIQLEEYQQELAHVSSISAPSPNQVLFSLSEPDKGLGGLLSGVKYSVQPPAQVNASQTKQVVGCGPFMLVEHDDSKLQLQAFDRYFGCRALPDQVTIWLVSNILSKSGQYHVSHACNEDLTSKAQRTQVEDGCMFLLFNQRVQQPINSSQRRYISELLSPTTLFNDTSISDTIGEPARNLLSFWHPILKPAAKKAVLPSRLSIATYDTPTLLLCAKGIQSTLENRGVKVAINTYSYRQLMQQKTPQKEEIVLTNINLDDNRHSSAFANLWGNSAIHHCLGEEASEWLKHSLMTLRKTTSLPNYLNELEPIASTLISEYWLAPLFHHRQSLRFHGVLKNVALTNWGWPDLRNVWSTD